MTDKNAFYELLTIYQNMDAKSLKHPTIPMGTYHQEAGDLYEWMQNDLPELQQAGLDMTLVDGFLMRLAASRHAQSRWRALRFTKAEAQREYAEKSPAGYDLRDRLVHDMLFGYRRHLDILGRVRAIAEGSGDADMLQDLSDLGELGRTYPEPLEAIGFDMELLNEADDTCELLSPLLAAANGESIQDNETKLNRDRAYTLLKEAVDEIREIGRYVFWRNPTRLVGYASEYQRRHRATRPTAGTSTDASPNETAAAS